MRALPTFRQMAEMPVDERRKLLSELEEGEQGIGVPEAIEDLRFLLQGHGS